MTDTTPDAKQAERRANRPVILAVDDDASVLASIVRDLRSHYGGEYRIVSAPGGPEARDLTREMARRGDEVALFLVDQRMPELTGTEFLLEARELYRESKQVLLTAYADTAVAIQAINDVGLDHYLLKPWDPPETHLYPVLDELLDDWSTGRKRPFAGIRILGLRWSPLTHDVKDFLALNQVPYRFLDVERDPDAEALLGTVEESDKLPIVLFPDGTHLAQPGERELAQRVGLQVIAGSPGYDLVIVGAGPAGLAAAVYGASEGLSVAVVERRAPGGQAGTSSRIENYLGFPRGISGADLARRAAAQAQRFGAEILTAVEATGVTIDEPMRTLQLSDGNELRARALLIASGMTLKRLDVPGYDRFTGAGVYYGATVSEGASYRDEHVYVIGGANSAGQAAMMFSRFAAKVTMVVRAPSLALRMSQYLIDQINSTPNIEVLTGTRVVEARGDRRVETIVLEEVETGETEERKAAAIFLFVGAVPHSRFVEGVVELDEKGFVLTGPDLLDGRRLPRGWPLERQPFLLETSVPGIFAAGDVRHGAIRRVAAAVGQGSVSISFVHRYLETV